MSIQPQPRLLLSLLLLLRQQTEEPLEALSRVTPMTGRRGRGAPHLGAQYPLAARRVKCHMQAELKSNGGGLVQTVLRMGIS